MANFIDVEMVRVFFDYDQETGILRNKYSRGPAKAGKEAGTLHECGTRSSKKYYIRICLDGTFIYAHRIIWAIMTGEQPNFIDHIDGDGLNNRWDNLRSVTHSINGKNQKLHNTNTSGTSGITFRKDSGRWRARIMVNDKSISLGTFKDKDEAINARKQAEETYWR